MWPMHFGEVRNNQEFNKSNIEQEDWDCEQMQTQGQIQIEELPIEFKSSERRKTACDDFHVERIS